MHDNYMRQTTSAIPPREQFKALGIASLGGMLEYFEFIIFVFLAPQISQNFSSPDMPEWLRLMQTFGIFAAGFLIRPVGGILMAQLGDLIGRKRIFTLTLGLMAVPTLTIALLPGYAQIGIWAPILLLACRLVQGVALGGELPGAISFVSEQVSGRRVAFALGVLASTLCMGSLGGSIIVSSLANLLGAQAMMDYGWRIPFVLGGLFGLLSVYLRRFTHETPVFEAMKAKMMLSERPPFTVLVAEHRFNLLGGMILAATTTIVAATTQQFPITFFVTMKHLPMAEIATVQTLLIAFTMVGNVLGGLLVSWRIFSLRSGYITFQLITIAAMFWAFSQDTASGLIAPFICLGISGGCAMGLSLTFLARAFPAQLRYTGLATCYNIPIAIFGGTALIILTFLARFSHQYPALYPSFFCLLSIVAALLLWPRRHAISPFEQNDPDANPATQKQIVPETAVQFSGQQ
ncbi:MFS transporter [Noviherbaspirillum sedimenti]|uniref:MFS transporter n=2 Tax=Noviherbaspirillum sedimenti TaxID=2320865 RepID=A0A3A3G6V0_9BURK|nr:MFS transporter [Noviherbaspirillum sedimenti]